jgi:cell division septum initiation protein DivIVA
MSAAQFSIDFPREDVRALFRAMDRAQAVLGKSVPQAQRMAMKSVLSSMAASTKVSKEFRDYRQETETQFGITFGATSRSGRNKVYLVKTKYATPKRKGKALRRSWQGPWREQLIYAPNEQELKQRRAVIIQMRGLAAETWRQAGLRGGIRLTKAQKATARSAHNAYITKRAARRWVEWASSARGDDPFIRITNSLPYIEAALEGGNQAASTAMARGARGLEHHIDKQLARMERQGVRR